jgi:raffinose/stachyose/melibiose transport system permease protein
MKIKTRQAVAGVLAIIGSIVFFIVPFLFIILTAGKDRVESSSLDFTWPSEWHFFENVIEVSQARNFMLLTAFVKSREVDTCG